MPAGSRHVPTTRVTLLQRAGAEGPQRRPALQELCTIYRPPVVAVLIYWGADPETAQDVAQETFAQLIVSPALRDLSRIKGSFGAWLLGTALNQLRKNWHAKLAQKRGGKVQTHSLDADPGLIEDSALADNTLIEQFCAHHHVERGMAFMLDKYREKDAVRPGQLQRWLNVEPILRETTTVEAAAEKLGITADSLARRVSRVQGELNRALKVMAQEETATEDEADEEVRRWLRLSREARKAGVRGK